MSICVGSVYLQYILPRGDLNERGTVVADYMYSKRPHGKVKMSVWKIMIKYDTLLLSHNPVYHIVLLGFVKCPELLQRTMVIRLSCHTWYRVENDGCNVVSGLV